MKGYEVVRSDGKRIGRVADKIGEIVVVELGRLRARLALPREFAHTTDSDRRVAVTTPLALLRAAPRVTRRGVFDAGAVSRHFGLV